MLTNCYRTEVQNIYSSVSIVQVMKFSETGRVGQVAKPCIMKCFR
jgi:hypothetical protein